MECLLPEGFAFGQVKKARLPEVLAVENASFSTPWKEESFLFALEHPELFSFPCILREGRIVAYALVFCLFEEGELQNIAVSPSCRRKGLGRALLRYCIGLAFEKGVQRLLLEVRAGNSAAKSLYETEGFVSYAFRKNYYRNPTEDAILMEKGQDTPPEATEKRAAKPLEKEPIC